MVITNNTKHQKYSTEWNTEIKGLSLTLDSTETDDTKKKSKHLEKLLTERTDLVKEQQDQKKEITKLESERRSLLSNASYLREANHEETRLTNNRTTQGPRMANFLGTTYENTTTAPTTNLWNTAGWIPSSQNHFTPSSGKLDNLYQVQVNGSAVATTEEQIINTIAYTVSGLKKIDLADFTAKYNAKQSDTTKQTKVKNYLTNLQNQEIIVGSDKDLSGTQKQPTYDFAESYQKYDKNTNTWTAYTAPQFNYPEFFELIELTHHQPFLKDLDTDKQKDVPQVGSWQIFKKGDQYTTEQLKDYGINIDPAKTTLYKTGSDSETISVNGPEITGWLELAHAITYSDDNKTKLTQAFTNSSTQQLLTDLKGWNFTNGFTTEGTNWTLPESLTSIGEIKDQLEMEKLGASMKLVEIKKSIDDKKAANITKQGEINNKESEIDTLIKEILTKKREQLSTYNLAKGFKKVDDANDHRREAAELWKIQQLLLEIRYLANDGDATQPSPETSENTALTEVSELIDQISRYWGIEAFENLAYKKDSPPDLQQAIRRIQAGQYTEDGQPKKVAESLAEFQTHFENKEKLVKLSKWETEALQAIKKAIGQQENAQEKLSDWQTTLKKLDPALDETIITESWKSKWGQIPKHQKITKVEKLIKKVIGSDGKVKSDFLEEIKKADATLVDLKTLLGKEPKDIITYISRYEYNHLTDTGEDKNKPKTQMERKIKKALNKTADHTLSEEELNTALYQVAVGELTLNSKSLKADLSEYSTETPTNDHSTPESHWDKYQWYYLGIGGSLLVIIGGIAIFWKQIKAWLNGPDKETEEEEKAQVEIDNVFREDEKE